MVSIIKFNHGSEKKSSFGKNITALIK